MAWKVLHHYCESTLKTSVYQTVKAIPSDDWNAVLKGENHYLSLPYLGALEKAMNKELNAHFLLFYDENNTPVGIASTQVVNFLDKTRKYNKELCRVHRLKNKIIESFNMRVLVCGNVFSTGENGFKFIPDIPKQDAIEHLVHGLRDLRKSKNLKDKVSAILLKEFWPESFTQSDGFLSFDYKPFMIDVNMVLHLREEWKTLEDYLSSMTSKFRTKIKGILKKSKDLEVCSLEASQIEENAEIIEELYHNVLEKSEFEFGRLNPKVFAELKKAYGKYFQFNAYYLEGQMIGWSSAFTCHGLIDANYVGLNYTYNQNLALYQRMLFDFAELAIQNKCKELRLGRTAEQIKSCLGAQPVNMKLYLRHNNLVSNKLISPIIQSITPSDFELRKPFKSN